MSIYEIRLLTGLSQSKFAAKYKIPVGTLHNWEQGRSKCASYIIYLLERVVREDLAKGG